MRRTTALAVAAIISAIPVALTSEDVSRTPFEPTTVDGIFVEQFLSPDVLGDRWTVSEATKETSAGGEVFSYVGKWAIEEPHVFPGFTGDYGLVLKSAAAHHAISAPFKTTLDNTDKTLVVQYEVKLQDGLECGGAYLKLLTQSSDGIQAQEFSEKTPYTIMFGPDKCGSTNKVHFIFRHTNPKTKEISEKHLSAAPAAKTVKTTTLYTLIVRPDQTFEIKINDEVAKSGSLLSDFDPPVNPPKEIDDPEDSKPADWVDEAKVVDTAATKPADWNEEAPLEIEDTEAEKPDDWLEDEPQTIPDPDADKPADWDDEEDGDWVAPSVPNPACESVSGCGPWKRPMKKNPEYKGPWTPPFIDNPLYKGVWTPRKIANPDYFEDNSPANFDKMSHIGFELWTMQKDILFNNIYIGHSESEAQKLADAGYHAKIKIEKALEDKAFKSDEEKKAKDPNVDTTPPMDFFVDPIGYVRWTLTYFGAALLNDPIGTIKSQPAISGTIAASILTFFAFVTIVAVGLSSPKAQKAVKTSAAKAKTQATSASEKSNGSSKSASSPSTVGREAGKTGVGMENEINAATGETSSDGPTTRLRAGAGAKEE